MEDYCVFRGYEYCRIDGQTNHEDRVSQIDEYNRPGTSKFIFLLTTRAGGLGINLATADCVIMYDNDWNPQVDLQAEDRAHRIGQKKQVYIYRFITENAIEEKVIDRATQKLHLDKLVIQQGRTNQPKTNAKEDLVSMIQFGADQIFKSGDSTISADDIEEILRKSEMKTAELKNKYNSMGFDDLQKFTVQEGTAYQWEGEDFRKKNIGMNWIGPSKRERKENGYRLAAIRNSQAKDKIPRPKSIAIQDYQFWPIRLHELQEKEKYAYWKEHGYRPGRDEDEDPESEKWIKEENEKIDAAEPLTEEEKLEKEELSKQGFPNWTKRDFISFCKANEKYGRDNIEQIAYEVEGKTLQEVKDYSAVFWKRYKEISGNHFAINSL